MAKNTQRLLKLLFIFIILILFIDILRRIYFNLISLSTIAIYLWDGIVLGAMIGLAGIGLSMVYSILNFANFAHGDYLSSGAFGGWIVTYLVAGIGRFEVSSLFLLGLSTELDVEKLGISIFRTPLAIFLGLIFAGIATVLIAVLIDSIVYKPLRNRGSVVLLIASIGVALALRYIIAFIFGTGTTGITTSEQTYNIFQIVLSISEISVVLLSLLLMFFTHILIQYTKLGKAMRATSDNSDLAKITGISVENIVKATWIIGGGLTGAAGYLMVLEQGTIYFDFGWTNLLLIFAAVILGGIGSIYGAILGGFTISIASRLSFVWLPSEFSSIVAFGVMIVILLIKPEGIFRGVSTA